MSDSQETCILCSQDAQNPLDGLSQCYNIIPNNRFAELRQIEQKRDAALQKSRLASSSYVVKKARRGIRMVKIQILDFENEPAPSAPTYSALSPPPSPVEDDSNVVISAQYVISDAFDEILECTENVVRMISKKLANDHL